MTGLFTSSFPWQRKNTHAHKEWWWETEREMPLFTQTLSCLSGDAYLLLPCIQSSSLPSHTGLSTGVLQTQKWWFSHRTFPHFILTSPECLWRLGQNTKRLSVCVQVTEEMHVNCNHFCHWLFLFLCRIGHPAVCVHEKLPPDVCHLSSSPSLYKQGLNFLRQRFTFGGQGNNSCKCVHRHLNRHLSQSFAFLCPTADISGMRVLTYFISLA